MSQLFAWGGQNTGVSALASFLPKNTQDWSPLEWTGWISLLFKGLSRVFSNTTVQKYQFFGAQLFLYSPNLTSYMTTQKTIALTRQTFDKDIKFWLQICKLLPISLWMNHFSIHFWMSRKVGNESVLMRSNYTIIGRVQRSREARSLAWQSEWLVFSNRPCYFISCVDLGKTLYFSEPQFSKQ